MVPRTTPGEIVIMGVLVGIISFVVLVFSQGRLFTASQIVLICFYGLCLIAALLLEDIRAFLGSLCILGCALISFVGMIIDDFA
jgi:hypothetical protein